MPEFPTSLPVGHALAQGQDSLIVLLLLLGMLTALDARRDELAGVFLSLALFRFQIALPIAFLFLAWRRFRVIAGFAGSAADLPRLRFRSPDGIR
jgi:Glycosyltransferase family 87